MSSSPFKRVARSGSILIEIPPQFDSTTTGEPPLGVQSVPCVLRCRDQYMVSLSLVNDKLSIDPVDQPSFAQRPNVQIIPFLALLGILHVARNVYCLVFVKEHEAVSYDGAIYRITKVALHQIGSCNLHDPSVSGSDSEAETSTPSTWSSTLSTAAGYGMSGIRKVGSTLKSSIGAAVSSTDEVLRDPSRVMDSVAQLLSSGTFYHAEFDFTRSLQVGLHQRWDWDKA